MAQTLNPSASVFRPSFAEEMNHNLDSLPDRFMDPHSYHHRSFEPPQFCRSPRDSYYGSRDSFFNFDDGFGRLSGNNNTWGDLSVSSLQQEFLKMERDLGRRHQFRPNSKPPQYDSNINNNQKSFHQPQPRRSPVRHSYKPPRSAVPEAYQAPPQQRRVPQKKTADFQHKHPKISQKPGSGMPKYDAECLLHLVRSQLEYYFSDQNLYEELHSNLQYYMKLDPEKWVPVHILLDLPSVAKLTADKEVVLQALRSSSLLQLNVDESLCRRPGYVTPADYKVRKNLRRSVLVYGLHEQMTDEKLRRLLNMHGNILCVAFAGMDEGPDPEVGSVIMKKKFNDIDTQSLKTAFVVFESQSQANKCVKARSRHSVDGIRTMHKYDYNKVVKRLGKDHSPVVTPVPAPGAFAPKPMNGMNANHGANFQVQNPSNKRVPLHHYQVNNAPSQQPVFLKRSINHNNNSTLKNNNSKQSFRNNTSAQKWRTPMKGSDSPNWRVNSPMRQRSNSTQNRSTNAMTGGDFSSKFRFSKENVDTFPILNTRAF